MLQHSSKSKLTLDYRLQTLCYVSGEPLAGDTHLFLHIYDMIGIYRYVIGIIHLGIFTLLKTDKNSTLKVRFCITSMAPTT